MLRARILVTVVLVAAFSGCGVNNERTLRRDFESNREKFETLLLLFREDSHLVRVAPGFTRLTNNWNWPRQDVGLSNERWERYRRLFEESGVADGLDRQGGSVFFYMSSFGLGVSGASRGVVFTEQPPSPIGKSLDERKGEEIIYVPLEGRWYLFDWAT